MNPVAESNDSIYLNSVGVCNAMGQGREEIAKNLIEKKSPGMGEKYFEICQKSFFVGEVWGALPVIPEALNQYRCRNNRLALSAALQIEADIKNAINTYGCDRVAVVMGSSTSGIAETELAIHTLKLRGTLPADYEYEQQEIGATAAFLSDYFGLDGPAYSISTACSSSGKVFASARGLIQLGLVDVVLVGGADSLCEMTVNGFSSLEATSSQRCNPYSKNRNGINIGEGAAVFLMTREKSRVMLAGVGESADAHHMSAPDPSGSGAKQAMKAALEDAGLQAKDIGYINLHGTATKLNDAMESLAVNSLFKHRVPCSSTKALTGHSLGAAGIIEAAICWLVLNDFNGQHIPVHVFDSVIDPEIASINLSDGKRLIPAIQYCMSNSFAFGGNNVSVILGRGIDD